ncbi:hypothetical protein [Aureimonas pseudogalii]|uniref:Uncharacterized protein n=1 Tax=Aureimonas pseudogalii TaxID=1744844 RepID=A0A7W6E977_9HYPH|nr:hypothetical protein [Aureimonas pseudogalii]MBB3996594.1 hypothetical protein [Aureimonas pseudogalii]
MSARPLACHFPADPPLGRLEAALRAAAAAFARHTAAKRDGGGADIVTATAARLGLTVGAGGFGAADRRRLLTALRLEDARRLRRLRAGRPGHDLGAHLALRRAICELDGDAIPLDTSRLPGRVLNDRFRRGNGRRDGAPDRRPVQPARATSAG